MTNDELAEIPPQACGNHSGTGPEPLGTSDPVQVVPAPTHTFVESVGGGSTPPEPIARKAHIATLAELVWTFERLAATGVRTMRPAYQARAAAVRWALAQLGVTR